MRSRSATFGIAAGVSLLTLAQTWWIRGAMSGVEATPAGPAGSSVPAGRFGPREALGNVWVQLAVLSSVATWGLRWACGRR